MSRLGDSPIVLTLEILGLHMHKSYEFQSRSDGIYLDST